MKPLQNNIFANVLVLTYIKTVIAACDWAVQRNVISLLVSRKIVHMGAAGQLFFWTLFDESHWTWVLNTTIPSLYAVQLVVKGLILADPNDEDVRTMSRTGRPIELCQGPLFFVLALIYLGLFEFKTSTATFIMAAMGFGD